MYYAVKEEQQPKCLDFFCWLGHMSHGKRIATCPGVPSGDQDVLRPLPTGLATGRLPVKLAGTQRHNLVSPSVAPWGFNDRVN